MKSGVSLRKSAFSSKPRIGLVERLYTQSALLSGMAFMGGAWPRHRTSISAAPRASRVAQIATASLAMGNRKNKDFQKILRKEGPDVFESTISFIKACRQRGIKIGVASSSRNCKLILELGNIEKYFETRVCGIVSRELNLKGKPDPDIFVVAAKNLGLQPHECVVVEDAISGVQAGVKGNFGLVLGVARKGNERELKLNGADIVVTDIQEIDIDSIERWFQEKENLRKII